MPLFEDWGKRLSEVAKNAGKMTRDVAETTRINLQINTKQEEIEKCYLQLGKAYYARQTAGGGSTEAMDALCAQISEMIAECEGLQKQVDDLKGQRRCPNCGTVQSSASAFCSDCGERLAVEKAVSPAENVTITWPDAAVEVQPQAAEPEEIEEPEAPKAETCDCGCDVESPCDCPECTEPDGDAPDQDEDSDKME